MNAHQKPISKFTQAELLEKLDDFEDWIGKDAARAAIANATNDAAAQALYRIAIYLPHGQTMGGAK